MVTTGALLWFVLAGCSAEEVQTALLLEVSSTVPVDCVVVLVTPETGGPKGVELEVPDWAEEPSTGPARVAVYPGGDLEGPLLLEAYGREDGCGGPIVADLGDEAPLWIEFEPEEAVVYSLELLPVEEPDDDPPEDVDCDDEDSLSRPDLCPCRDGDTKQCFTFGPKEMAGIGQCEWGTRVCRKGRWGPCEGQVGPSTEECNGVDNSCDGVVDSPWLLPRVPCERTQGVCALASRPCVDGVLALCTDETYYEASGGLYNPDHDECFGLDNNCDGIVDGGCECNPLTDEPRPCYSYGLGMDDPTFGVGTCAPGLQHCVTPLDDGLPSWGNCIDDVIPEIEVCDGLDRSCSGVVDDVMGIGEPCEADALGMCKFGQLECHPDDTELARNDLGLVCVPGEPLEVDEDCDGIDATCTADSDDEIAECGPGWLCCDAECHPPGSLEHCGSCGNTCAHPADECSFAVCEQGSCGTAAVADGTLCDFGGGTVCAFGECMPRCFIEGEFWEHGEQRQGYPCQRCDIYEDPESWTNLHDGTSCSGGTCHDGVCRLSCALPWGGSIDHGESVTAYESETVPCEEECQSQVRQCDDGTLLGSESHEHPHCDAPCAPCDGETLQWGAHDCQAWFEGATHREERTESNLEDGRTGWARYECFDGDWQLENSSCTADGCSLPWTTVSHESSVTAYQYATVDCEEHCPSEQRECIYGELSGTFTHQDCEDICENCHLWGLVIEHGDSVEAHQTDSVPCDQSCPAPQTRTCHDGDLDGTYQHQSCSPVSCGGQTPHCCDGECRECCTADHCDDQDSCTSDECIDGVCHHAPFCAGTDEDCGCTDCVDCTAMSHWQDVGDPYDCCDGDSLCTCQDEEYVSYSCEGTDCVAVVTDTFVKKEDCASCPDGHVCEDGACVCVPDCSGRECGPDPICGESCGECDAGEHCNDEGACVDCLEDHHCDDGNDCTGATCGSGICVRWDVTAGEPCDDGDGVCDGDGQCTDCGPSDVSWTVNAFTCEGSVDVYAYESHQEDVDTEEGAETHGSATFECQGGDWIEQEGSECSGSANP